MGAIFCLYPVIVETILGLKETSKDKKGFFIEAGAADGEGQIMARVVVIFKSRPIL